MLSFDWLKSFLTPREFQLLAVVIGVSSVGYAVVVKLDKVIENQVKDREARKALELRVNQCIKDTNFVMGQNSERNKFNNDISRRIIRVEQHVFESTIHANEVK